MRCSLVNNYIDNQMKLNNYVEGAIMAALAAMIALIGLYIPPLQFIVMFIWLVPIVVVAVRRGFYTGVLALVTAAVLLMILAPPQRAFIYLVQFGALGIVFSYYFSKKAVFSKVMVVGTIVSSISTAVGFALFFLIMGLNLSDIATTFEEIKESTLIMYENLGLLEGLLQRMDMTIEELRATLAGWLSTIVWLTPALVVINGMSVAFVTCFVIRKTLQKLNLGTSELPMFRHWQIPWHFAWGVIIALAFMLSNNFAGWELGGIIGMNIMFILSPIFLIQGLAVLVFYYHKWQISFLLKVLLLAIIVLFFPYVIMLLLIIGLLDPLFNYRRLDIKQ